jgi:hypothetical protein
LSRQDRILRILRNMRLAASAALCAAALTVASADPAPRGPSGADPALRLPPGTHSNAQGELLSGRGLRDTTDFLTRELERRGIATQRIGPYVARGVELTRFLSQSPSTPWLAIHVLRAAGTTKIFFVPRPSPP